MCPGFEISVLRALFLEHLHVLWCSYYYQHRQAFFFVLFFYKHPPFQVAVIKESTIIGLLLQALTST